VAQSLIHPSAVIDPSVQLGEGVRIGPYCTIGPNVIIGNNTELASHVVIEGHATIGEDCYIASMAVLGGKPQDRSFKNEPTRVLIGDRVQIREYVTIHRPTGEGNYTIVGDDCFLMAYVHLAHNCKLGQSVTIANSAQLAGHVEVGDHTVIGGLSIFHQYVRIGRLSMIGGDSGCREDIPPFSLIDGKRPTLIRGLNKVALKRQGVTLEDRMHLKRAFQKLFFSDLNVSQAIQIIQESPEAQCPLVAELVAFMQSSKRTVLSSSFRRLGLHAGETLNAGEREMLDERETADEASEPPSLSLATHP
jgi:UDP-N-acetylglucosamine acyltransferase